MINLTHNFMKKLQPVFALFMVVSLTIFISSCKKKEAMNLPPVANFTFSGENVPAPSVITFTNSSTNATTFSWTFGDGGTSTDQNPQHSYLSGGTYTVQLTATGTGGSNTTSKTVTINDPAPVANFTFTGDNQHAPCTVTFTNSSTNASTYNWTFGDGGTSTDQNPVHTFLYGGTFSVLLTAVGKGGTDSITKSLVVINSGTNITFNNPVYTDILVTLNGSTQTITPGSSVTFYSVPGSSVSYIAKTSGKATDGTRIGKELDWAYTINLPGGSVSYNLVYTADCFFMFMINSGTHTLTPLYVNCGLSDQTIDNILIPNNNLKYRIGYYDAHSSTMVRAFYQDLPSWCTQWQNLTFPGGLNQSITLTNTFKKSADSVETHVPFLNPQTPQPAGNLMVDSKVNTKAINAFGKLKK
jgi:PKD repeat protein